MRGSLTCTLSLADAAAFGLTGWVWCHCSHNQALPLTRSVPLVTAWEKLRCGRCGKPPALLTFTWQRSGRTVEVLRLEDELSAAHRIVRASKGLA